LTDAIVSYLSNGVVQERHSVTLLFNRVLADSIIPALSEVPPDVPIAATGPFSVMDFTNELHQDDGANPTGSRVRS
jgi:hypothetical protein